MKRDKVYLSLLYLLSPLLGFILSFKSNNRELLRYNITLFSIWIGFTFSVITGSNSDVIRYFENYKHFEYNNHSIEWLFNQMYVTDGYFDIFSVLTTFIFTKLGFDFEIYLGFLGLIFSVFYSKFIIQLLDLGGKFSVAKKIVFLFALVVIPVWYGINNIRFMLATMIVVTSLYELSNGKNIKKNFLLICLTPLIHFSVFWVPIIVFLVTKFPKYINLKILLYSFIVLAILPMNSIVMNTTLSNFVPTLYEERASSYVDLENISRRTEVISESSKSLSFHAKFLRWPYEFVFFVIPVILGLSFTRTRKIISTDDLILLKWILLFGSIIAVVGFLPSFGRFRAFVILPSILLLFKHWDLVLKSFKPIVYILVLMMILYSFVKLRTALDCFSITTILGNPISLLLTNFENRTALIELIK